MLDLASLHLRPFVLADAGSVEPWLEGPGLSLPAGQLRREWPRHLVANTRIVALVAELRGKRVGFVRLDCGPDHIAEVTLVVAPQFRRAGFGGAMFRMVLRQARRLGLRGFLAMIDVQNTAALSFFGDQGFVQDGMVGDSVRLRRFVHAGDHAAPLDLEA